MMSRTHVLQLDLDMPKMVKVTPGFHVALIRIAAMMTPISARLTQPANAHPLVRRRDPGSSASSRR